MAKKEFKLPVKKLNLSLDKEIPEVYKEALEISSPSLEAKETIRETIIKAKEDYSLTSEEKTNLVTALLSKYEYLFSDNEISDDYNTLKEEIKFLAGLTAISYVVMAKRLKKIRDEKLYLKDGYTKFEQFIEEELSLARNTVYKYMDVVNIFEKDLLDNKITEPSKLIEALPLVKKYPQYKEEIVKIANSSSARAVKVRVNEIRSQIQKEEEENKPFVSTEYLSKENQKLTLNTSYEDWSNIHRGEYLEGQDRLVSYKDVMLIMEDFKKDYPYWIDIADLLIKKIKNLK